MMKEYTKIKGLPKLADLFRAADEARVRVSEMSWEERKKLREAADRIIKAGRRR